MQGMPGDTIINQMRAAEQVWSVELLQMIKQSMRTGTNQFTIILAAPEAKVNKWSWNLVISAPTQARIARDLRGARFIPWRNAHWIRLALTNSKQASNHRILHKITSRWLLFLSVATLVYAKTHQSLSLSSLYFITAESSASRTASPASWLIVVYVLQKMCMVAGAIDS